MMGLADKSFSVLNLFFFFFLNILNLVFFQELIINFGKDFSPKNILSDLIKSV